MAVRGAITLREQNGKKQGKKEKRKKKAEKSKEIG